MLFQLSDLSIATDLQTKQVRNIQKCVKCYSTPSEDEN